MLVSIATTITCRSDEPMREQPKGLPSQVIDNFTLTETSGENASWRLTATRADIYSDQHEARVFGVRVDFYEDGLYTSTLTSREGTVDTLRHNMVARGNVVLVSKKDGAVLKTEELRWDAEATKVASDTYFTLERGKSIIRGQGFTATPGLESFTTTKFNADIHDKEMKDVGRDDRSGTSKSSPKGAGKR